MIWLPSDVVQALREAVVDTYRVRDLAAFSAHVARALPAVVGADFGGYAAVNRQLPSVTWLTAPPGAVPPGADRVLEGLVHDLPVTAHRLRTADASALKLSDFVDRTALHRHPVYRQLLRGAGIEHAMGVALAVGSVSAVTADLYRASRDFSERDRSVLNLLRPHLAEAHEAARTLTRAGADRLAADRPAEAIAVDRRAGVRGITRRAGAWLSRHFAGGGRQDALPEPLERWIRYQEEALLAVSDELPLPRRPLVVEAAETRLVIRLLSDPEESCVLLERVAPAIRPASLEDEFALTGREAEVLAWVAQGKSNAEVAGIIHARPRTIEKHLERVYRKLGVDNRFAAITSVLARADRN